MADEARSASTTAHYCSNPAAWHPTMHTHQEHHHPPTAWRNRMVAADPECDKSWWKIIPLCGFCHDEYHTLLNAYIYAVRNGLKAPPYVIRKTYSLFVQRLVAEAWKGRPSDKPPFTSPSGVAA